MGSPRKGRKAYDMPIKPYDKDSIEEEKKIMRTYGLRRKKEVWKAKSILRNFRQRARNLQSVDDDSGKEILINRLNKIGIGVDSIDSILDVGIERFLDRRLQTIVFKKGMSNSVKHSRQVITHGHVLISDKKMNKPSFIVPKEVEKNIKVSEKIKPILTVNAAGKSDNASGNKEENLIDKASEKSTSEKDVSVKEDIPKDSEKNTEQKNQEDVKKEVEEKSKGEKK